jgi:hypothetical protein
MEMSLIAHSYAVPLKERTFGSGGVKIIWVSFDSEKERKDKVVYGVGNRIFEIFNTSRV